MNAFISMLFLALMGASVATLAAEAEDTPPAPSVFVEKAALDGMTEVELGKIALDKSQDPVVRRFAQRMITDHGKTNQELTSLARAKGLDAPTSLDAEHQAKISKLKSQNGAAFDKAYCEHVNMERSTAIALFESASKTPDPELAGFARKTLPTLKEHKQMAEELPD